MLICGQKLLVVVENPMKFLFLCLFTALSFFSFADTLDDIKKDGVLKIGVDVGYQPFEMKTKTGKIIGFDIDMAQKLADELGVKLEILNIEWDGIIPALLANKFHIIMGGMTITEKRKKRVSFTQPYLDVGQLALVSSKYKSQVREITDLNSSKYKIASRIGTTGEQAAKKFFPKAKYKGYQDRETAAMDVLFGRIDAFIYDSPYINVFNTTRGKKRTFTFKKPFTEEPIGWAIKKNNPKFLNKLNEFLSSVKKSSFYSQKVNYWFEGAEWLKSLQ